jgi:hypothetical protein
MTLRLVEKFDRVRAVSVEETELAKEKPEGYVFKDKEVYWVERNEDLYGWHHFKNKVAVLITREDWIK